jgi:2-oxoglutarate dehydrogenase E1 component
MYAAWREDPSSVDASWKTYFEAIENGKQPPERIFYPSEETSFGRGSGRSSMLPGLNIATQGPFSPSPLNDDQAKIQRLIRAFQDYGHLKAKTNPLDLPGKRSMSLPELQPNFYGFTEVDLDRRFALGPEVLPHFATNEGQFMALREIIKSCETVYCSSIGAEYSHLSTREEREWVRQAIECPEPYRFSTLSKSILTVCNIIIIGIAFAMVG